MASVDHIGMSGIQGVVRLTDLEVYDRGDDKVHLSFPANKTVILIELNSSKLVVMSAW